MFCWSLGRPSFVWTDIRGWKAHPLFRRVDGVAISVGVLQNCQVLLEWDRLSKLQLGKFAEQLFQTQFAMRGFETFMPHVDERGVDFLARSPAGSLYDVQVKSVRDSGYVFLVKDKWPLSDSRLVALCVFCNGQVPDLFGDSCALGFSWTLDCERVLAGGVSRWGNQIQESAAAEEARRATGDAAGRGRGGRLSARRKRETVLRLLRGEDLESVSRELGITAARAAQWRDQFLAAGQASLKSRAPDAWDEANRRL